MIPTLVNSLFPIVALIVLGAILRATRFLSPEFFTGMNRLCYWVALPALLFHKLAGATFEAGPALSVFAVLLYATLACVVLAYIVALVLRLSSPSIGSFVQASFRGNLVYVGLPVILFALAGGTDSSIESMAIVAIAPLVPIYNIIAVVVLSLHGRSHRRPGVLTVLRQVATNPLLLACVAGGIVWGLGVTLPVALSRTLTATGQIALPLALLAIGSSMTFDRLRGNLLAGGCAALVKVAAAPAIGYGFARWTGLSAEHTTIVLIYLACPTAIASYVMAGQLKADEALAGNVVVISTLASLVSLSIILLSAQ